jgi:arylsulfatase A-like enzyme
MSREKKRISGRKVLFLLFLSFAAISCDKKEEKPNILWITLEDTSPQFLATYGGKLLTTPTLDALAREGVIFNHAYATGAVCSPSRNTIITGCSTEALGTGNHRSKQPIPDFIKGFPYYLQKAGYYTTNNSKTDYNIKDEKAFIQQTWNESSNKAGWWNRETKQPFFAVFNYNSCHQSRTMSLPWLAYQEMILDQLPDSLQFSPQEVEVPPFLNDSNQMRKHLSRVPNSLRKTDLEIQELLQRLENYGLKENTIIFIYADHGEGIPRGKTHSIGFGHRVPFYIWFPEKYKHLSPWGTQVVTEELISLEDLAPTILSLTGCEIPKHMKGRPFIGKKRKSPRKYVYGSRNRLDESPGLERTVFDGRFVYSRNFHPRLPELRYQKYGEVSEIVQTIRKENAAGVLNDIQSELLKQPRAIEYLYDIQSDPWEVKNFANDPIYKDELLRLRKVMKQRIIETNDIHFLPEGDMIKLSEGTTAFALKENQEIHPIQEILEVADRVGRESNTEVFMKSLKHKNKTVRYWAAVGLNFIGKTAGLEDELIEHLQDESPYVQVEIATLLYKTNKNSHAKAILIHCIMEADSYVAHHAMQQLIYLPNIAPDFTYLARAINKRYGDERQPGFDYSVQNAAQMYLYLYDQNNLYYKKNSKSIEDMNQTVRHW